MCQQGTASLALFNDEFEDSRILVRGDELCAVGDQDAMNVLDEVVETTFRDEDHMDD